MLAQPAMAVVFVPDEKINLGRWEHLTAEQFLSRKIWNISIMCHSDEAYGKP